MRLLAVGIKQLIKISMVALKFYISARRNSISCCGISRISIINGVGKAILRQPKSMHQ
jgi:hypothetical protein